MASIPDLLHQFREGQVEATAPRVANDRPTSSNREHYGSPEYSSWEHRSNSPSRAALITHISEQRSRPSSPPRSTPSIQAKPAGPRPASSAGVRGFFSVPGELYATPPAVVARAYGGFHEGQLQYQFGKVAPLLPMFAPAWLREPPQRPSVNDLRLQPSSRALSCYSPEFVASAPACPPSSAVPAASRPASAAPAAHQSAPSSPTHARQKHRHRPYSSTASPSSPMSPVQQARLLSRSMDASNISAVAAAAAAAVRGDPPPSALHARASSARWGAKTLASFHAYNRRGRDGHTGNAAVGPVLGTHAGGPHAPVAATGQTQHTYFSGIKKGLARSPLTEALRATATSTIARDSGSAEPLSPQQAVKRASIALDLSRLRSRVAGEAGALLTSPPKRTTHHPTPGESMRHVHEAKSHEASPRLKYKDRVSQWGK